jgi:uncharacterized protein YlxW (UPF0749 family)
VNQGPPTTGASTRADGSMSLLVDMMTNSLDSSYAEAAARKREAPHAAAAAAERPSRRAVALLLLVSVGLVTGTAAAQVRRHQAAQDGVRAQLVADVQRRTAATDDLAASAARLRADVAREQAAGLSTGAAGRSAAQRLAALELAAGVGPVTGAGLVVRLDDAAEPTGDAETRGGDVGDGRVQDHDLQEVVNALWASGAEAISINGLRLTAQTAIRSAGEAILVDFRPLSPPYTVRAVGDAKLLETSFVDGPTGRRLGTLASVYGLQFVVRRTDSQTLPGSGFPTLRLAKAGTP